MRYLLLPINYDRSTVIPCYILMIVMCCFCSHGSSAQATQSDLLRNKAEQLFEERDYAKAMRTYQQAFNVAMPGDRVRAANLCVDISTVYHTKGDFGNGKITCLKGLALLRGLNSVPDSVTYKLHASLGQMYHAMYMHDSAHYHFGESLTVYQKHQELANQIPDYVAYGLNNHALLYLLENNFGQAETLFEEAIEMYQIRKDPEEMAVLTNNYAGYLDKTGQYERAIAQRNKAITAVSKKHPQLPSMLLGLAWDYFATGNIMKAKQTLLKAKVLEIESPVSSARLYYGLAQCDMADKHYVNAELLLKKGMSILSANEIGKGKLPSEIYLALSRIREQQGEYTDALEYIQKGLIATHLQFKSEKRELNPEFEGALSEISAFQLLWQKARILKNVFETSRDISSLKNSLAAYETLINFRNKMLARLDRLDTQTYVTEKQFDLFEEALSVSYHLWELTRNTWYHSVFFSILENSRASALAVGLLDLRVKPVTLPDSLTDQERKLQQRIARAKSNFTNPDKIKDQLNEMEFELVQIQNAYQKAFPAYYKARYAQERIALARLQQLLPSDQTYLDYFTGKNAVFAIGVTNKEVQIKRIDMTETKLQSHVNVIYTQLHKDPGLGAYSDKGLGKQLYRMLLQPFDQLLKPRLLIARGGMLNKLPFEVLQINNSASDYLIFHKKISYSHAATIHFNTDKAESRTLARWLTVAPFSRAVPGSAWSVLKSTSETALRYGGDILRDKKAEKSRFIALSRQYEVLNLATHAIASDRLLDESFIAFHPEKGSSNQLHAAEIMKMELPKTRLVILGACQGGAGAILKGEGIQSLAYSFAYAGCPSVLSTIWTANDTTTAFLTEKFAIYSQEGYNLDEALYKARMDYFESGLGQKYDHPFYWSNLVLWGQSTPLSTRNEGAMWLLLLIPISAIVVGIGWKTINKRQLRR